MCWTWIRGSIFWRHPALKGCSLEGIISNQIGSTGLHVHRWASTYLDPVFMSCVWQRFWLFPGNSSALTLRLVILFPLGGVASWRDFFALCVPSPHVSAIPDGSISDNLSRVSVQNCGDGRGGSGLSALWPKLLLWSWPWPGKVIQSWPWGRERKSQKSLGWTWGCRPQQGTWWGIWSVKRQIIACKFSKRGHSYNPLFPTIMPSQTRSSASRAPHTTPIHLQWPSQVTILCLHVC